jgi:hypothetical protein
MLPIQTKVDVEQFNNCVVAYQGGHYEILFTLFTFKESSSIKFGTISYKNGYLPGHGSYYLSIFNISNREIRLIEFIDDTYLRGHSLKMRAASPLEVVRLQKAVVLGEACHHQTLDWLKLKLLAQKYFANQILFFLGTDDNSSFISDLPKEIMFYILILNFRSIKSF